MPAISEIPKPPLRRPIAEPLSDLRPLRALIAVVEEGGFTLAAKRLRLTQSAVTHSVKTLEDSLGWRLLDRSGASARFLTDAGEIVLRRGSRVLRELRIATRELDRLKGAGQSRLQIGAPHSLFQFLLAEVLDEFHGYFPRCERAVQAGSTATLLHRIREHEVDLAFCLLPRGQSLEGYRTLFRDRLSFVISPLHPWAEWERIGPEEMRKTQFVIQARAPETRRLIEESFDQLGVLRRRPFIVGEMGAIKELAKTGLAVAIVAPWVARQEFRARSLMPVPIPGAAIEREWGVCHSPDRQLSVVEEKFVEIAAITARGLGETGDAVREETAPSSASTACVRLPGS